jgi:hypothetical protein
MLAKGETPMTYTPSFAANREVRPIPGGWQHPRDVQGRFRPLLPADERPPTAREARRRWFAETGAVLLKDEDELFMPVVEGLSPAATEIAAYETTSEGTPISPPFANTPEGRLAVANWCAVHCTTFGDNRADAETWAAILFGDGAWVSEDGRVEFA